MRVKDAINFRCPCNVVTAPNMTCQRCGRQFWSEARWKDYRAVWKQKQEAKK